MAEPTLYQRRQSPVWMVLFIILALGAVAAAYFTKGWHISFVFVIVFTVAIGLLFSGLKVTITQQAIQLAFGIGVIRRSIPRDSIESVAKVRNSWWYGFGIRLTPHGWMWNIAGLDAIEITYKDGGTFRIGTDEPDKLLQVLGSNQD